MTHASLFSGIGAAELAATWIGWQNLFHCEINPFCRKVLEYHYPNSISYDDITKTDFTPWHGKINVLTAGFPCQPFSTAGLRRGASDDRYLWPQALRAVRQIHPAWFVGENVAGLLTMVQPGQETDMGGAGHLFDQNHVYRKEQPFTLSEILDSLEREGYAVQTFLVPACAVGAPHRRDRVWIVARLAADTDGNGRPPQAQRRHGEAKETHVQFKPILHTRAAADTDSDRQRHGQGEQEPITERERTPDDRNGCKNGIVADTLRTGRQELDAAAEPGEVLLADSEGDAGGLASHPDEHRHTPRQACDGAESGRRRHVPQPSERGDEAERSDGLPRLLRLAADTQRDGRATCELHDGELEKPQQAERRAQQPLGTDCPQDWWRNFPTQSPVCTGNDGISGRLAGITFPRWRAEAIKALGNAMVPQVIYEIFRAIEENDR